MEAKLFPSFWLKMPVWLEPRDPVSSHSERESGGIPLCYIKALLRDPSRPSRKATAWQATFRRDDSIGLSG